MRNKSIVVQGTEIAVATRREQDYISLTDMFKKFGDESILYNWLRNRNTIEFLGIWEQLYNPDFKPVELEGFKSQSGLNSFALSPKKWIEATGAIGIYAKSGCYGRTGFQRLACQLKGYSVAWSILLLHQNTETGLILFKNRALLVPAK